ncbi:MAG: domain containing protein [Deltaproteobacteria bacterium]|nr:domain containing protein [Deltaproteobacteria bacterium]
MFTIIIQEKGGEQRRMVFNKPEVTIGRVQGNDIVLPKGNVSKRHARIVLKDGKFIIVDLKSTNGTYVNGRKITSPLVVKDSDKIYIGDFIVGVDEAANEDGPSETTTAPPDRAERAMPAPNLDVRPPRPTEAQPMQAMPPMGVSEPPPPTPTPRPGPPRPAPGPSRDLGGSPMGPPMSRDRDPGPASREPGPQIREPGGPGPSMPPIGSLADARPGRPPMGRPEKTMPPPIMAPIPPMAPAERPSVTTADQMPPMMAPRPEAHDNVSTGPSARGQMPSPQFERSPAMAPGRPDIGPPASSLPSSAQHAPAPVVPLSSSATADKAKRGLVGAGARRVIGRSVSMPSRRGVQIEPLDPKVVKMLDLQSTILERLRAKLDIDKIPIERLHEEDLWQRAERATIDLVETLETSGELPKYIDQDTLIKETLSEALALGPLEDLLADEKIDEIIIDRRDRVVVGKDGVLRGSGKAFSSDEMFERVVKRLVAEAGATIDDAHPVVDLRMRDGTRLTAAISPIATRGACLVLKKSPTVMPQLADLVPQNAMSSGMADFLATCVTARRNILVCGGPGSGKTTVVAALAASSPTGERVVSIEEIAELAIARDEWIQLETRPGIGMHGTVDLGHLLETALRLAPDRLVVGEVRGREAMTLINSLCSSVDGAIVAMMGEGAPSALGRLVSLARVGASGATDAALRELVAQAFEIVVHVARWSDGTIKVLAIEEVVGCTDTTFESHLLFHHRDGSFVATGTVPRFYAELEARGIPADQAVFR